MLSKTRELNQTQQSLRDEIAVRTKVQLELKDKNKELQSILETIPQIAFTAAPDGAIEFVNAHWFEYSANDKKFPVSDKKEETIQSRWQKRLKRAIILSLK